MKLLQLLRRRRDRRRATQLLEAFRATFGPDACPVCFYHRYGLMHGLAHGEPTPHDCPEGVDYETDTALHPYADVGTGLCGLCGEHESWHPERKT